LKTLYIDNKIDYSGNQLVPHWIYKNFKLQSDSIVAFTGKAEVPIDNMVDINDATKKTFIYSPLMLHFIVEHFDNNLDLAIYRKRILIVSIKEELEKFGINITRMGDDLYANKRKLSISKATRSAVSTLIHTGINIETEDTPVKTSGLRELGIKDIKSFAENIMIRYKKELEEVYEERCKVRGI